ncbi:helix-turn-helix domain-containing protein [Streptomyces lydicus]|uniref:helix-turn-helix domain-containing protein n=1 Tax=Streptomyces lydicus TaxID=47763 RepID=UPI003792D2EE
MARPMNALPAGDAHDRRLLNFAAALRSLREQAGKPSLAEMSQRSGVCIASLSDAHSGLKLPTWRTVRGYVRACGVQDTTSWHSRWDGIVLAQRTERAGSTHAALMKRWANTQQITPPQWIKDEVELARLLDQMRRFRGLSLRDLARRSAGFSHHTYGAVLRGGRPVTTDFLLAMLQACSVDRGAAQRWLGQLARVRPAEALRVSGLMAKFDPRRARGISPHSGFRGPRVAAAR